jgi:hypothetical protein
LTFALMIRALWRVYRPLPDRWIPNLGVRALATVALLLLALNVYVGLARNADDAGFFVNLGAQRLRERGLLPYGDPLLTGTPAAAYGPVLYVAHVPFQMILKPRGVNDTSPDRPVLGGPTPYFLPPPLATNLCTIAFHLAGVFALFVAARRMQGTAVAWALVALYCGSAYVLGVGSEGDLVGGMTFISHIGPASTTLVAFALLNRPAWSGAALAVSIGVLFYPLFLVPAWMGYYWTRKPELLRALAGFSLAAALIGGTVLLLSRPAENRGLVSTIMHDTLGHQEDSTAYGLSPFGFWGTRSGLRWQVMQPLVPGISTTRPVVLAFFLMAGAAFFVARGRRPADLALLVAAIAIGAQLWKIHGTGTYVTWYYPFLLLGFFANAPAEGASELRDIPLIATARAQHG